MKSWLVKFGFCLGILITLASIADHAHAEDTEGATKTDFRLSLNGWVPSLFLDAGIRNDPDYSSDTSLFDVLDMAFLADFEIRRGRWGALAEFNYVTLSSSGEYAGGLVYGRGEIDGFMAGANIAYRPITTKSTALDVFVGARYWLLDTTIDFRNGSISSLDTNFIDPLVGVRGIYQVTDRMHFEVVADVGGLGLASNVQWNLIGRVGYRFNESLGVSLAYRHLSIDFGDAQSDIEAALTGPMLSVDFRW